MRLPTASAAQNAIAAMTRLAEVYDGGVTRLSSLEIARARNLQKPFVAKLLTTLSQAGLVEGAPGPHGGYALAKPPAKITLFDVAVVFQRDKENVACPYGPDYCGHGPHCPLHDALIKFNQDVHQFMERTTFEVFRAKVSPPSCVPEGRV